MPSGAIILLRGGAGMESPADLRNGCPQAGTPLQRARAEPAKDLGTRKQFNDLPTQEPRATAGNLAVCLSRAPQLIEIDTTSYASEPLL
jgi:hypothetical protein